MANAWETAPIVQKAGSAPAINPTTALERTLKEGQIKTQAADLSMKPLEAATKRAEAISANAAASRAPYQNQEAQANAAKARAEAVRAAGPQMTAEVREKAISAFNAAKLLHLQIADIESKYAPGPGSTKGVFGLEDYFPTTNNVRFDTAGNSVRGNVGTALNFTGGQLNTPREAEAAVGPFLPHSADRDIVALDKIQRLKDLRDKALHQSIQMLGGVPDAQGNIVPIDQAEKMGLLNFTTPDGSGGPPKYLGDNSPRGLATGKSRNVSDPKTAAVIDALVRNGGTLDEANAIVKSLGPNQTPITPEQFKAAQDLVAKGYKGPLSSVTRNEDNGWFNRTSASPAGAYTIGAADALTGGTADNVYGLMGGDPADARAKMASIAAANPKSSMLGGVTGAGMAAALTETGLGALGSRVPGIAGKVLGSARTADGLYGMGYGAGSSDDDRITGALLGGTTGMVGGMFGRGLARTAGKAARGVTDESVKYLNDLGVPLTFGQAVGQSGRAGNAVRSMENSLSGAPVIGDMIKARQREGFQGVNRAAFDQGLSPIGATTNGVIGAEGVDAAKVAVNKGFRDSLDPVNVSLDPEFGADYTNAALRAGDLPQSMADNAGSTLSMRIQDNVSPAGDLTGNDFQQSLRGLKRDAKSFANQPYGHDFGEVTRQGQDALEGLLQRQAPDALPAYKAANAANRNVSVLKDAVNRARNGVRSGETDLFSPSQLSDAAAANARQFGGSQGTTQQPFYDLTRHAQKILPSNVPDSGTAGRLAALAIPSLFGATGGAGGWALGDAGEGTKYGLGLGAVAALGGSKTAQKMLVASLLKRPDWLRAIGEGSIGRAPYVGMAFSGLGSSLAPSLVPSQ